MKINKRNIVICLMGFLIGLIGSMGFFLLCKWLVHFIMGIFGIVF